VNSTERDLPRTLLGNIQRGIEKESLRVRPGGALATTPHPQALGSALTHPHITTDFSESQLELITGVHSTTSGCLDELKSIHQFVYRHIGEELLWCASMPCDLPDESAIPIGRYGRSNVGRAKTIYRTGLSHRYGRRMQVISGLHYNFSLAEDAWPVAGLGDASQAYFALIRNFRRHAWLLLYLFGASPAVCASFVAGRAHELQELAPGTWHLPHATSLRMGRLGYLSAAQDALAVSCNDLASYAASLDDALNKPYPAYEAIGIRDGDEYRQLATSMLQIENEFYSTIRPKRVVRPGERPLHALRERGVEYVEVRAMDLDPFSAIGITAQTVHFLDVFLLHCLLSESPPDTPREIAELGRNKQRVAARGREPGLRLDRDGETTELREWAAQLLAECETPAKALDEAYGTDTHRQALSAAAKAVADPERLPSARVLREIMDSHDGSFHRFALAYSREHRQTLLAEPFPAELGARYERMGAQSLDEQARIEASDRLPFESYRQLYLSPDSLRVG
jgi:glutamate--cysteine ligase